ncbi:hypothetical protein NOVO_08995 [Rickettsiales bacterium Ac37b]|nr:hypothetical protein NOVO_08995 [Rickettsiales bacterium Ac37b]
MELYSYLKVLLALSFVIALIIVIAALFKKFNLFFNFSTYKKDSKLNIEDMLILDNKRKIVLVRYVDSGYLILLGHNNETLIKSDINLKEVLY